MTLLDALIAAGVSPDASLKAARLPFWPNARLALISEPGTPNRGFAVCPDTVIELTGAASMLAVGKAAGLDLSSPELAMLYFRFFYAVVKNDDGSLIVPTDAQPEIVAITEDRYVFEVAVRDPEESFDATFVVTTDGKVGVTHVADVTPAA